MPDFTFFQFLSTVKSSIYSVFTKKIQHSLRSVNRRHIVLKTGHAQIQDLAVLGTVSARIAISNGTAKK